MAAKAYSTKGTKVWLGSTTTPVAIVPTAISKAAPAIVTAPNSLVSGSVAYVKDTGFAELDGKYFVVQGATATQFTLKGSDTTESNGTLVPAPVIEVDEWGTGVDLSCIAKTIAYNSDAPGSVQAGTYCEPSLAIASPVQPPSTIDITGNINVSDDAYRQLNSAWQDGLERVFDVVLPQGQGNIVGPVIVSTVNWELPVDGVQGFSASLACSAKHMHRF